MKSRFACAAASAVMLAVVCGLFLGCKKETADSPAGGSLARAVRQDGGTVGETEDRVYDLGNFFTPDYTPYAPEPENTPRRLTLSAPTPGDKKAAGIVPGLRKLADYLTAYTTNRTAAARPEITPLAAADVPRSKNKNKDAPFTVADWGPRGTLPAEVRYPSFYVLFSEPVVALSALGTQSDKSEFFSVEPAIAGVFRWNGTSLLSFDCTEPADPLCTYTITVSDNVTSLDGKPLTGERVFSTTSAKLAVIWDAPGYSVSRFVDSTEVPPECAQEWRVQFNYPVDAAALKNSSVITVNDEPVDFVVRQELADTVTYSWAQKTPFDADVYLAVTQERDGTVSVAEAYFHTLSDFRFKYDRPAESYGTRSNPVRLIFSHPVDVTTATGAVTATGADGTAIPVTQDNLEAVGHTLTVFGLPLTPRTKYTIAVSGQLKDIYGRTLTKPFSVIADVPGSKSMVRFTDSGTKMLESRFPHRLVFEHQNIDEGEYTVFATDVLCRNGTVRDTLADAKNKVSLKTEPRDTRLFEMVDFENLLKKGKGWVEFDAAVKVPRTPTRWDPDTYRWEYNWTSIQVTDLGVTVRYAMNRIVVMVTQLSDGTPVAGASVSAGANGLKDEPFKDVKAYAEEHQLTATTDKNGLAVIDLSDDATRRFMLTRANYYTPVILVEKDDDKAMFLPDSHYPWRSGVHYAYGNVPPWVESSPRIFMFSDRGLYKPGETVSFRGIDRDQVLGSFVPYQGEYSVTFKEDAWRNAKVFGIEEGTTSENGGFYGSFSIPDDITPGNYVLEYKRGADGRTEELYITVAFFERLKFQAAVAMPKTPVIVGDRIQANLSASYLAGGALAGAPYTASWFRESWYFTSDAPELKQYTFGPRNTAENRNYFADDESTLDATGVASLACETTGNSIKGAPYRYRVSANVTDVSNQLIAAGGTVLVHPARYYIGLAKPATSGAFARTGEKITFPYKLATPDGAVVSGDTMARALAGGAKKITVTLTREEWNLVQQQGISDIYTRYEKTDVLESEQAVTLGAGGTIAVTPQEPGYHKVRVASTDSAGRDVITEYEFFVTGSGKVSLYQDDAASLRLTPDKSQYNPGETAHILLESPLPQGNYLITVEREGIFTEEIRHFDDAINVIDIPVARNYVPVFYVSVASYSVRQGEPTHSYGEIDLDKPKGYYGATTLFVNPRVKSFSVAVESAKPSYRPGETAEVTLVATKGGKPLAGAELTLLAVDRGVLDLINYHVPDPIAFFYDPYQFPLRVKGGDSRALLMDPVTYAVKNLSGGDTGDDGKMDERSDFNPTAVFEPHVTTDENGRATVRFTLPDTLTTYRVTVFGVDGELLALQEDEIAVQNPINVQQVLPRELRERDTAELGVLLTNLDGVSHDVTVSLALRDGDLSALADAGVEPQAGVAAVDGANRHTVSVPSGASVPVYFDLAAQKAGVVTLEFTVASDVLNERLVCPLKIDRPYLFETVTTAGSVHADEADATERLVIPSFADGARGDVTVTLDATRLGLLGGAVQYLFEYPFGCLEQQSSRMLPLVIFGDYIDTFGLESNVTDVRKCVLSHFKSWKDVQHADGGFGYWPTSPRSNRFVSLRIAHLYALALRRGYTRRDLAIDGDKLLAFVRQDAERGESDYIRAYRAYVLALNGVRVGDDVLTALIAGERQDIAVLALAGLAAYEQDGKDAAVAKAAAKKIRTYLRPTARGVDITNPQSPQGAFAYYGDMAENLALTLQLFTLLDADDSMNTRLIFALLANQRAGYWKNTATTARALEAFHTVITVNNLDKTRIDARALLGGETIAEGTFSGAAAKPVTVTLPLGGDLLRAQPKDTELPLQFVRKGKGALYYTASLRYAIPGEMQDARDEGLGVTMRLFDGVTGAELAATGNSPVVALESGKTYKAKITLSASYDRAFIALRAPVPSGAEILDATFVTTPDGPANASGRGAYSDDADSPSGYGYGSDHYMSNQAIYNNEIQFFWDSFGKGTTTVEFSFRAVRRGVYPTPPANAECMYEPEIFGRTGGTLYTIR
ncbi:MAG: Ig-like domain-containing protein [Treponemataceae bacterium]|nr:Ig-like domain-containing protein [Treponemataceae bacterium]